MEITICDLCGLKLNIENSEGYSFSAFVVNAGDLMYSGSIISRKLFRE